MYVFVYYVSTSRAVVYFLYIPVIILVLECNTVDFTLCHLMF